LPNHRSRLVIVPTILFTALPWRLPVSTVPAELAIPLLVDADMITKPFN
jgi:hypothetical protein